MHALQIFCFAIFLVILTYCLVTNFKISKTQNSKLNLIVLKKVSFMSQFNFYIDLA